MPDESPDRVGPKFQAKQVFAVNQPVSNRSFVFKHPAETQRSKRRVIKRTGERQITNTERNVMQHGSDERSCGLSHRKTARSRAGQTTQ
jgi:hypothetical protein